MGFIEKIEEHGFTVFVGIVFGEFGCFAGTVEIERRFGGEGLEEGDGFIGLVGIVEGKFGKAAGYGFGTAGADAGDAEDGAFD